MCDAQQVPVPTTSADESRPGTPQANAGSNISSQAIELTEKEKILLGDVRDRDGQLYEPPMYKLLAKMAEMKKPGSSDFDNLPWPGYRQLLDHPSIYRAQAMRVRLNVITVEKIIGVHSLYYPKDKPYWLLHCFNAASKVPPLEPLIVICPFDPTEVLGKPNVSDKEYRYDAGRQVELAGVFYKIQRQKSRGWEKRKPELCNYPVFIGWDIRHTDVKATTGDIRKIMILLIVAAMAATFFLLRRHVKRLKGAGKSEESEPYKPSRYEPERQETESQDDELAEVEIDEELTKAVQEFQKEQPDDHPAKD